MEKAVKPLKIFVHSMDGLGHLNACIGMAQTLKQRGHRVIFVINSPFAGQLEKYGFEEILLHEKDSAERPKQQQQNRNIMKESGIMLKKSGFLSGKTSLEKYRPQADWQDHPFLRGLFDKVSYFDQQIQDAIEQEKPGFL